MKGTESGGVSSTDLKKENQEKKKYDDICVSPDHLEKRKVMNWILQKF